MPGLQSLPVSSLKASTRPAPKAEAPKPAPIDSAADSLEIQPAPDAAEITVTVPSGAEPLGPKLVDSTGKKTLKRILRTIEGSPTAGRSPTADAKPLKR
jgi:hypothetical protein